MEEYQRDFSDPRQRKTQALVSRTVADDPPLTLYSAKLLQTALTALPFKPHNGSMRSFTRTELHMNFKESLQDSQKPFNRVSRLRKYLT